MEIEYGFLVCRACLSIGSDTGDNFISLFEEGRNHAEIFHLVFRFEISEDRNKHFAVICTKCFKEMNS